MHTVLTTTCVTKGVCTIVRMCDNECTTLLLNVLVYHTISMLHVYIWIDFKPFSAFIHHVCIQVDSKQTVP